MAHGEPRPIIGFNDVDPFPSLSGNITIPSYTTQPYTTGDFPSGWWGIYPPAYPAYTPVYYPVVVAPPVIIQQGDPALVEELAALREEVAALRKEMKKSRKEG